MEVDVRLRVGAVTGIGKEVCSVQGGKHEKQGFDSMKQYSIVYLEGVRLH